MAYAEVHNTDHKQSGIYYYPQNMVYAEVQEVLISFTKVRSINTTLRKYSITSKSPVYKMCFHSYSLKLKQGQCTLTYISVNVPG